MTAHVAGVPVEESLLPVLGGVGAGLLMARAWVASRVASRVRRPRSVREGEDPA